MPLTDTLDLDVRIPNHTKMPYDRWQLSYEIKKHLLEKYRKFICKSRQSLNGDVEAEIHSKYDKDHLYFQFQLANGNVETLKNLGDDCKKSLDEKYTVESIVSGNLKSSSGKKESLNF
ncbi:MAG: hypothetical protein ACREBJ_02610 [Nitrosotalea sp.]